jgi:hypothetical protein
MALAQIVEMDQERDRKTCIALDLKVTGANHELAQWLLDHPRYSGSDVAGWLGCSKSRVNQLRKWASEGFRGSPFDSQNRPDSRERHDLPATPRGRSPLETNDNSESDDDFDPETGEVRDDIAAPEVLEDNILHAIGGMNENARIFNKLLRDSALDREAVTRINTAIDRAIGKWRSIQSTLERKG